MKKKSDGIIAQTCRQDTDHTDKQAETELHKSKELYRLLAEQAIVGMHILQDGLVKYVNHATAKITGYSIKEMMDWAPEGYRILPHPEELPFVMEQVRKKQTGDPDIVVNYTWRIIAKSGEIKWVESYSKTISFEGAPADFVMMADITERKQTEEALRESERKYQLLFDNSIDAIAVFGGEPPKFIYVNSAFLRLFGYTLEEILAFSPDDIFLTVYPDDREMVKEHLRSRFRQEDNYNRYEFRVVTKDGQVRWVEISATLFSKNGQFLSQAICRDITERKRMEEEIRKSENKYRNLFESANDTIFLMDQDIFIDCNQKTLKLFDCTREQIIGQHPYRFSPKIQPDGKNSKEKALEKINAALKGQSQFFEWKFCRYDRSLFDAEVSLSSFKDKNKYFIQAIVRDITERKRTEEDLRNSHRRLEDIIDFLPDATLAIDREGKVVAWNKSIEQVTEISKANMIGRGNYEYALPFYGERRPLLVDLALLPDDVFENNHYKNVYRQGDTLFAEAYVPRTYGGQGAFMWGTASRLRDKSGNIIGAIESIRDITENKRKDEELRESEEKYRTFFKTSRDCVFITSIDGRWMDMNDAAIELFGYSSRDELMQVKVPNLYVKAAERTKIVKTMLKGGFVKDYPIDMRRKDGAVINTLLTSTVRYDVAGNTTGLMGTIKDITKRKKAEDLLNRSEAKYRNIFENAMEGIYQTTMEGRFITANNALAHMIGYDSPEELIESVKDIPTQIYVHPEDRQRILEISAKKGFAKSVEIEFYRKDGSTFWVELNARMVRNEEGKILYVEGFIQDVTTRRQAQELLSRSEKKFSSIFHFNFIPMTISDIATGQFIDINEAFTNWTGYSREEVIGLSTHDLHLWVNPGDREKILGKLKIVGEVDGEEVIMRQKNGNAKNMLFSARFIEIDGKRCLLTFAIDITEQIGRAHV